MKKISWEPRRLLLTVLPWLHTVLIIAPIYSYAAHYIRQTDVLAAWLMGFSLIIPTAVSRLLILRLRSFFVYMPISLLLSALWFLFDPILGVVVLFICLLRLAGRLRTGNRTVFDTPHYAAVAAFLLPYVFSAADDIPALQLISLLSALVYGALTLIWRSLSRLDDYITMNRDMADFPMKRVSSTTMKTVLTVTVTLFSLCILILLLNFSHVTIPELMNPGAEIKEDLIVAEDGESAKELHEIDIPHFESKPLNINWDVLGRVFLSFAAVVIVTTAVVVISHVARGFSESAVLREEKDTIEDLRDEEEKLQPKAKLRDLVPELSVNAYVRRKYRRAVHSAGADPKPWQSPREIEEGAGIRNTTLHELYEKARYSESGCSNEDKKLL